VEHSTRLSIVEFALADVVERLDELPPNKDAETLRELAEQYSSEMASWEEHPPEESKRVALLKSVLDLNVQVIRAGGRAAKDEQTDVDGDDDFPKPL
jgi:hypothetical protein